MNTTKMVCPISEAAAKFADCPAIIFGARAISYLQLEAHVWSSTKYLKKIGIQPQDKVVIVSPSSVEYVIVLLALWRLGAVACLMSTRLPSPSLCQAVSEVNAAVFLSSSHKILSIPQITLRKFPLEEMINFDIRDVSLSEAASVSLEQEATIMYTSGTSHEPKAVLHTYGNHYFNALGANENIPLIPGHRWLLSLPLYHVGGLAILFRVILSGAALVIPKPDEPPLDTVTKYKITHVSLVTTQLYRMLHNETVLRNSSSLKAILLGGSSLPNSLLGEAIQKQLPIYLTYGLTEMASQVATTSKIPVSDPKNSNVKVLPHRELKISSDPGGEIWVKGKTLFKGYCKNGKIILPLTEEGWFKTNDLGLLDAPGNLKVTGRKDNMFICGGENIQPEEIERYLCDLNGVEKAVVVPLEDKEFGFRPVAFLKFSDQLSLLLNKDAVVSHLEEFLPRFKIPVAFYQWPQQNSLSGIKNSRRHFMPLIQGKQDGLKQIF